jgi:hypothetical protein
MNPGLLVFGRLSLSWPWSLLLTHTCTKVHWLAYHNKTQDLDLFESTVRLMYLRSYDIRDSSRKFTRGLYNSTSKWITTSLTELMYRFSMYDDPPNVWGTLTSSIFYSLSFITPTPSHFLSLTLSFSVIINNFFFSKYLADYDNLQTHRETDRFFAVSGVQLPEPRSGQFHFRRTVFSVT